jgi:hypothetical protein
MEGSVSNFRGRLNTYLLVAGNVIDILGLYTFAGYQTMLDSQGQFATDKQIFSQRWTSKRVVCLCYGAKDGVLLRNKSQRYIRRHGLEDICRKLANQYAVYTRNAHL